ncbi:MAG: hypothetical protein NT141_00470 [candidate division WWE3 bacterium]|nr:hypothetical protein [candidate division WWE3 bacterium]
MIIVLQTIKKDITAKIAVVAFVLFTLWWLLLSRLPNDSIWHGWFAGLYGIIALWGGINGILIACKWGGFKSTMGKALIALSVGLILQEFGQLAYSYYISILGIDVPYPSIGDAGFFGSIPFYALGVIFLAKAVGVQISFKSFNKKWLSLILPVGLLALSYVLFLRGYVPDFSQPFKVFLDFGYPIGQAVYISIALVTYLLSRDKLGGVMKNRILFVLGALLVQYCADSYFLYQASNATWSLSGLSDYLYVVSYFVMAFALIQLRTTLKNLRSQNIKSSAESYGTDVLGSDVTKYEAVILAIINEQRQILGSVADDIAKSVNGLEYSGLNKVKLTSDPKLALEDLVKSYSQMFGATSVEVSKDALKRTGLNIMTSELPDILK